MTERVRGALRVPTLAGGAAIGSGAVLMLVTAVLPLPGVGVLSPVAAVLVLVGAVALTVPSGGVAGRSRLGVVALVVLGANGLLIELLDGLVGALPLGWGVVLGMTLVWLTAAAGVGAAVAVRRARVLHGFAAWVWALPAAAYVVMALMETVPPGALTVALTAWDIGLSVPISLLLTGVALIGFQRWAVLGRRARSIDASWRASTAVGARERETSSR